VVNESVMSRQIQQENERKAATPCCMDRRCCTDGNPLSCTETAEEVVAFMRGVIGELQLTMADIPFWEKEPVLQADLSEELPF